MKAIFFDLDNTIYDHRQYCLSAFKKIADYLAAKYHLPGKKVFWILANLWREKTSAYPRLFNDLLLTLKIKDKTAVKSLVRIFNQHEGRIAAYSGVIATLSALKQRGYALGIITDGNINRQARKIKMLGIKKFFKIIIYTKKISAKPSKKPFIAAAANLKINPQDAVYIGDHPEIDFPGAKACGMKTVRLLRGEFKNMPANKYIDYEIKKFSEILKLVNPAPIGRGIKPHPKD